MGTFTRSAVTLVVLLAACSLPPRETDRSTPEGTFRTFRGAVARAEYEREWECISDQLRRSLGIENRLDWKDARAVVLTQDSLAIKGLKRAKITGEAEELPDGRIRLPVAVNAIVFSIKGTVTLRREVVLRAWLEGQEEPEIDDRLDNVTLVYAPDGIGVRVPPELIDALESALPPGTSFSRFEAAWIWFLDEFDFSGETEKSVGAEVQAQQEGNQE